MKSIWHNYIIDNFFLGNYRKTIYEFVNKTHKYETKPQ